MPLRAQQIVSWLMVLLCVLLIFGFSSQEGKQSESLSFKLTAFVMRLHGQSEPDMTSAEFLRFDYVIRKIAHVSEYCLLALSLLWALWTVGFADALRFTLLYAICFTLAFADEWRQTTVPGRVGCFGDVLIDQLGVAVAAAACLLLNCLRKRKAARI